MHTGTALLGLLHPSLTSKFPAQPTIDTSVPFRPSRLGEVVPRQGARSLYGASWGLIGETKMASKPVAVHWFRKGLRLHDNLAFREACDGAAALYPLFIWDSNPASPESRAGSLRTVFLLESLKDLDDQLRARGSRLFVVHGRPEEELPRLFRDWRVTKLTFEADSEPRSLERDREVRRLAEGAGVQVETVGTSTLRCLERYLKLMGKQRGNYLKTYGAFMKLHENAGPVPPCAPDITGDLPPPGATMRDSISENFSIPTLADLGVEAPGKELKFRGGEREALSRLEAVMEREVWISRFEKPKTSPNSIDPSTTVLSMYISHGCLSPRRFWHALCRVYDKKGGSRPPVSLQGQLLWREFNYFCGYTVPNFDKMVGNPVARQIPWDADEEKLAAWREAKTGFPFIDAIMTQLREEGWMHHLARHAVACFLTRGDLWQSWEKGAAVFDELLLDADWSINNFNWQWLSCTAFFYQATLPGKWSQELLDSLSNFPYFRCYSPVAFGKKTDKNGDFIRKYLPVLRNFPSQYIYEPWLAPLSVQRGCRCIIGKDYPKPIVDHSVVSDANKGRMHDAYDANGGSSTGSAGGRGGSRDRGGGSGGNPGAKRAAGGGSIRGVGIPYKRTKR